MSLMLYFASDMPLEHRPNPHFKPVSVNQALEMGIPNIPESVLVPGFDRDKPGVLLITDLENGTPDDDWGIVPLSHQESPVDPPKAYMAEIEGWKNDGCARGILEYIRRQLEHTDEIQFWSEWLGDEAIEIRTKSISLQTLTPEDLVYFVKLPCAEAPGLRHCLQITK